MRGWNSALLLLHETRNDGQNLTPYSIRTSAGQPQTNFEIPVSRPEGIAKKGYYPDGVVGDEIV
jgi:hypothetical protein